ncbi:MDR family MFS transporter [Paenibacillus aurantius]|uniref:MDR family MFS transporter n=1 Tax=Paenibacillus aurantius TaxID=2918900 RepID=A0AA96RF52_9BACL|nr:MDR family MFS transporter [Paenibacillus aurantius]WNQ13195.1 MDR family MFS transporter [Paenibacillus aurantius]
MEKQSRLGLVIAGLMLGVLMAGMDNTIVATAMGTIVSDLGGFGRFVWVTSTYIVAEMAGMPLFGKLSDMYGRKRFFLFGLIVFLIGSSLSGTAESITQLSIYRAIQGFGAGALIPIAHTIVFDLFPPEKRGKMVGLFGAVFGLSTVSGPLLGAYIAEYIGWPWVFYINLPIGLVSLVLITWFYREAKGYEKQPIDWLGILTLIPAIVCLMLGLEWGGKEFPWGSNVIIGLFTASLLLILGFLIAETKAKQPIIPFPMFQNRLFAASTMTSFFYSGTFILCTLYLPIFVQGVMGGTATNSGYILLPLMLGAVAASLIGGHLIAHLSYRTVMIFSSLLFVAGIGLLSTLSPDSSKTFLILYMIVTGLGMGSSFSVLTIAALHPFEHNQRGVASSTISFIRSLGMSIGISVFGIYQRQAFERNVNTGFLENPQTQGDLFSGKSRALLPADVLDQLTAALSQSISHMFLWALIPAAFTLVLAFSMSGERPDGSKKVSLHH